MNENRTPEPDLKECADCPQKGACCHFSAPAFLGGSLVYSRKVCPHLNRETGLCKRYETRSEVPWCGWVGNIYTRWPSFCPHVSPRNRALTEDDLRTAGVSEAEIVAILDRADALVEAKVKEQYGDIWGSG